MKRSDVIFYTLAGMTAVAFTITITNIFLRTPEAQESAGGLAQKIFYFHVPSAYSLYVSGTACFIGSAAYLLKGTEGRNALATAGADCAAFYGVMVLTSGPLWAKKAWGVYWTWDPQLTTLLLTVLIYVAVVVLRSFSGDGAAERRFAAALGVLGTFLLPVIHVAVKLWGGNHPEVVMRSGGKGLQHPAMVQSLLLGFLTMTLLTVLLLWIRTNVSALQARVRNLEEEAASIGLLD